MEPKQRWPLQSLFEADDLWPLPEAENKLEKAVFNGWTDPGVEFQVAAEGHAEVFGQIWTNIWSENLSSLSFYRPDLRHSFPPILFFQSFTHSFTGCRESSQFILTVEKPSCTLAFNVTPLLWREPTQIFSMCLDSLIGIGLICLRSNSRRSICGADKLTEDIPSNWSICFLVYLLGGGPIALFPASVICFSSFQDTNLVKLTVPPRSAFA